MKWTKQLIYILLCYVLHSGKLVDESNKPWHHLLKICNTANLSQKKKSFIIIVIVIINNNIYLFILFKLYIDKAAV